MSKIFDSVIIYGSGTTNSSTLETLNGNKINTFTIKDNGNVGIGTNSPSKKLDVRGQSFFDDSVIINNFNPTLSYNEKLHVNGNVFLGVNSSNIIYSTSIQLMDNQKFSFGNNWGVDKIIFRSDVPQKITTDSVGNINFITSNKNFTYSDVNNVGIGTSSPTEKLEVSGKTKSTLLQMTSGATEGYLLTALDNQGNIAWKPFNNEDITELAPVISIQSTPPISNIDGDRYLISGGTGVWSGKTNLIGEWLNPNWLYTTGVTDNTVFVTDTLTTVRYNGSNWVPYRGTAILQNGNKLNTSVNIGSIDNNDVNFRSSGTTRMTIKNNGNVGIGTATPTAKLHVVGNASTGDTVNPLIVKGIYDNTFLISNQNAYGNPNRMGVYSTIYDNRFNIDLAGSAGQFRLNYGNSKFWMNPYPMANSTTFLFASNPGGGSGEAGIEHTVNCLGSYNIGEILNIGCGGSSTGVTYFGKYIRKYNFNNPNATFYPLIALDGNVGFGTNTPTASLHLINTTTGHTFIAQDSNPDSTPFVIDNDGNVGIGTATPTAKLNVSGRTYITESLGVGTSPVNQGIILGSTQPIYFGVTNHYIYNSGDALFVNGWNHLVLNASNDLIFKTNNIGSFFVDINQNIGVNVTGTTTDSSKLQIRGIDSSSSNYGLKVQNSGGTDNFVVRNDGNVGIGTSTPDNSAILQVDSTTKGFLPPRMTASQAEAISNPSEGLMVYITGGTGSVITSKGWWGTTGTTSADWVKIGP